MLNVILLLTNVLAQTPPPGEKASDAKTKATDHESDEGKYKAMYFVDANNYTEMDEANDEDESSQQDVDATPKAASTPTTPASARKAMNNLFMNPESLIPGSVMHEIATTWKDEVRVLPKALVHPTSM